VSLDGVLVVDKPVGPTSHDVVARVRRILGEPRIGHTGTLDPMASGVLPLVLGRATRLVRFLTADDKRYEATIRLGFSTDTYDRQGQPTSPRYKGVMPSHDAVERALDVFRGTFQQQPPAFSAKKIDGRRSYRLARAHARAIAGVSDSSLPAQTASPALPAAVALPAPPALPASARVTASSIEINGVDGEFVHLRITCSAGFYVRSLAHDLGAALGVGAHLTALRRMAASGWTLADAVPLAAIEEGVAGFERARAAVIPLRNMLHDVVGLALTPNGVRRALSGCNLGPGDVAGEFPPAQGESTGTPRVKLLDPAGNLVGIAEPVASSALLHPVVVLM
jgi:tRNA pseudouridine55 synthase